MRRGLALIPLAFGAAMVGYVVRGAQGPVASAVQASTGDTGDTGGTGGRGGEDYVTLDRAAEPFKSAFNADVGKIRILMLVAPT